MNGGPIRVEVSEPVCSADKDVSPNNGRARLRDYIWCSGEVLPGLIGLLLLTISWLLWPVEPTARPPTSASLVVNVTTPDAAEIRLVPQGEANILRAPVLEERNGVAALSAAGAWIGLLLGLWLVLLRVPRGWLWFSLYHRGQADAVSAAAESGRVLLASQQEFVDGMVARLSSFDLRRPGPLWGIRGGWGSGKSLLMDALHEKLEQAVGLAVVNVHVWREQSAQDLHLAIVEAILSHPRLLRAGFRVYPTRIVWRKIGHAFLDILPAGLRFKNEMVDLHMFPDRALPIYAQRDFERVVAAVRARGVRIVLILDEIDRATVPVAQSAIALTRRAFGLPGLAIVLPYVEAQLRQKVFNPLHDYSVDLHNTLLTHLAEARGNEAGEPERSLSEAVLDNKCLRRFVGDDANEDGNHADKKDGERGRLAGHSARRLLEARRMLRQESLLRWYWHEASETQRLALVLQSEEKYLSLRINVPPMKERDIPTVYCFKSVMPSLRKDWRQAANHRPTAEAVAEGVRQAIAGIIGGALSPPAVRHLEGYLAEYLDLARADGVGFPVIADPEQQALIAANQQVQQAAGRGIAMPLELLFVTMLAWRKAQHISARISHER